MSLASRDSAPSRALVFRHAAQSVLHFPQPGATGACPSPPLPESTLAKPPNFKQEKKRREDQQRKRNEEKQRQHAERKANVPPQKP